MSLAITGLGVVAAGRREHPGSGGPTASLSSLLTSTLGARRHLSALGRTNPRMTPETEVVDVTHIFHAVHLHSRPHMDLQRVAGALCCS
ncbi:hypothetical protein GCM10010384_11690 [Streptomyces djakartensis]|uniref:Secreted protein n=1 Tax=Streptomyces djakartensis TaxID=68193 RepID=A0ABQ2ZCX9_9ACTN|nr:hypothetical protein GCM10010384_11690 [Streptomyces djakartensis]